MDTKDLTLEEGLETKVVKKKIRKRKAKSSVGKTSGKKYKKVHVNQSAVATTELSGKVVQGEVASQSCGVSPREKVDDSLTNAAIGKVIESGERNDVSMADNQQTTDADMLSEGKRQKSSKDHISQPAAIALANTAPAPAPTTSRENVNEINGVSGNVDQLAIEKEELVQALSSELSRSAQLEELNKELSRKLEAQTKRLELLTAQKMAIDNVSPEKQQPGSSQSYKKAKLTASQSQPDEFDDELLKLDFVPVSEAN